MSVRRRRRHRQRYEGDFFIVFSLAFVLFGVVTAAKANGSDMSLENVTDRPETEITSTASDSFAVASTDVLHGTWSAIDHHTIPLSGAYDNRTIPSSMVDDYPTVPLSTADDYRTIPSSVVNDYHTIPSPVDDHGQPTADMLFSSLYVNENHHLDLTEAADHHRPTKRPSIVASWNRYPPAFKDKRLNRYGPATTVPNVMTPPPPPPPPPPLRSPPPPPIYGDKCHGDGHSQAGPPAHKTATGTWAFAAPLVETALPLMARLRAVRPSHWLLFALGKLAALVAAKSVLLAKAFVAAKVVKLLLLPLVPLLWSWFAAKVESSLKADAAKPATVARIRRVDCRRHSPGLSCVRNGSPPPLGSGSSDGSGTGPPGPYRVPADPGTGPAAPGGPDPPAALSAFETAQTPTSGTTVRTTEFRHFRDRASVRSARRPMSTERFVP